MLDTAAPTASELGAVRPGADSVAAYRQQKGCLTGSQPQAITYENLSSLAVTYKNLSCGCPAAAAATSEVGGLKLSGAETDAEPKDITAFTEIAGLKPKVQLKLW